MENKEVKIKIDMGTVWAFIWRAWVITFFLYAIVFILAYAIGSIIS